MYNKQLESIEINLGTTDEIDNLLEKRDLPKKPDNNICLLLSGLFIFTFLIIVLIVVIGLKIYL